MANVGIYASPGVWKGIVGDFQPSVPYWMADYLNSTPKMQPQHLCRYHPLGEQQGRADLPTGPLLLVQYNRANGQDYDYAC